MKPGTQREQSSRFKLNKTTIQRLGSELHAFKAGRANPEISGATTFVICPTCDSCVTIHSCLTCHHCPEPPAEDRLG